MEVMVNIRPIRANPTTDSYKEAIVMKDYLCRIFNMHEDQVTIVTAGKMGLKVTADKGIIEQLYLSFPLYWDSQSIDTLEAEGLDLGD